MIYQASTPNHNATLLFPSKIYPQMRLYEDTFCNRCDPLRYQISSSPSPYIWILANPFWHLPGCRDPNRPKIWGIRTLSLCILLMCKYGFLSPPRFYYPCGLYKLDPNVSRLISHLYLDIPNFCLEIGYHKIFTCLVNWFIWGVSHFLPPLSDDDMANAAVITPVI